MISLAHLIQNGSLPAFSLSSLATRLWKSTPVVFRRYDGEVLQLVDIQITLSDDKKDKQPPKLEFIFLGQGKPVLLDVIFRDEPLPTKLPTKVANFAGERVPNSEDAS